MPFSLYIHIPYCLVKCPYCDFNAYGVRQWPEAQYTEALCMELQHYAGQTPWRGESVQTVYFGGGTPSLFAPSSIRQVLHAVSDYFSLSSSPEITLEADPASVTPATLAGFRDVGVNRLSFGIQSFQPALLKTLGRLHTAEEGLHVLSWAREAGFTNLNMDFIFGVPGQTLDLLHDDLTKTLATAPEHISLYNLTYEEGTPFFRKRQTGQLQPVDEEEEVAMFSFIREWCVAHGYQHYEISNFARPGFSSRHNVNYWQGGNYLGLGAGAHSFTNVPEWGRRWSNERKPKVYMKKAIALGHARDYEETLTRTQARGEFVFLNLRQMNGLALPVFARRFGVCFTEEYPHLEELLEERLLQQSGEHIALTPKGVLIADTIFASFF
jgi:oxygen-independent coproporphyrinogen-3 oxidase